MESRPFHPADAEQVASWVDSLQALITWSGNAGFTWPFHPAQLTAFHAADPSRHARIVLDPTASPTGSPAGGPAGSPVGHFALRVEPPGHSSRLGMILINPAARGRGLGTALIRTALAQAFADPAIHAVTLGVYTRNTGATRLYERLGFRHQSVQEQATRVEGEWWASITMRLPRSAWRPR